ncbi:MAG: methyltransferase domain-containing protein [Bacteroidetes bacterium]|nr:methyltransferase domain-containing protein [Bacteroidota bacterium]
MRIISGRLGGRRFLPPAHMPHTRPTTDIAKEGLFNILQHRLDFSTIHTLDLFAGTGSISYELASRGTSQLTLVEKDLQQVQFIKKTLAAFAIQNASVMKQDVFQFLQQCTQTFDFIFAGPPYALTSIDELPKIIMSRNLISPGGLFVLEHTSWNDYQSFTGFERERNYGTTVFSFFVPSH